MSYVHKHYPSWRFHPTEKAKLVKNEAEDEALSDKDDRWGDEPHDNNYPEGNPLLAVQETPERQKLEDKGKLDHKPSEHETEQSEEEMAEAIARKRKDAEKAQKDADKLAKKAARSRK